ncbi:MAG: AAA family ATPase [Planctomycetes bacterium]|nr:AAA family ATPase [Planctomycetota bacterium]
MSGPKWFPEVKFLHSVKMRALEWLMPGFIPKGKIVTVAGDPGVGKGLFIADLAARISVGEALPGDAERSGDPGGVFFCSEEDSLDDVVKPRILAAGGNPKNIRFFTGMTRRDPDGSVTGFRSFTLADIDVFREALKTGRAGPRLIVFDPVTSYLGKGVDANSNGDVRTALAPYIKAAEESGATIVLVTHLNKSKEMTPNQRINGATAFAAISRSVLMVTPGRDADQRCVFQTKSNLDKKPAPLAFRIQGRAVEEDELIVDTASIEWSSGPVDLTIEEALEGPSATAEEVREVHGTLRERLKSGPASLSELYSLVSSKGVSERQLRKRLSELKATAKPEGRRGPWMYRLPEDPGSAS